MAYYKRITNETPVIPDGYKLLERVDWFECKYKLGTTVYKREGSKVFIRDTMYKHFWAEVDLLGDIPASGGVAGKTCEAVKGRSRDNGPLFFGVLTTPWKFIMLYSDNTWEKYSIKL